MKIALALYKQGEISAEQLAEALCEQSRLRKPIGQIALEKRLLTVRDTMQILCQQAESPGMPFGEIACSLGLLTRQDVAVLLGEQELSLPPISSVLLRLGYIEEHHIADQPVNLEMQGAC